MEDDRLERVERLQCVKRKNLEWEAWKVCTDLIKETLAEVDVYRMKESVSGWLLKLVDKAVELGDLNMMPRDEE